MKKPCADRKGPHTVFFVYSEADFKPPHVGSECYLVPSRFMRKFVCRLRLNEVNRQ